jgi:hypothetical protein
MRHTRKPSGFDPEARSPSHSGTSPGPSSPPSDGSMVPTSRTTSKIIAVASRPSRHACVIDRQAIHGPSPFSRAAGVVLVPDNGITPIVRFRKEARPVAKKKNSPGTSPGSRVIVFRPSRLGMAFLSRSKPVAVLNCRGFLDLIADNSIRAGCWADRATTKALQAPS